MLSIRKTSTFALCAVLASTLSCGGSATAPHAPEPTLTPVGAAGSALAPATGAPAAATPAAAAGYSGLGAASVPPELLAAYAPKPLPGEITRHIQAMLDIRAPGPGQLSPDGKTM